MSKSALAAFRHFWHRRYARWSVWQDRVDYIDSIHDQDRLRAAPSYPPSPALPSSREMEPAIAPSLTPLQPWHVRFRRPVYNPHSKIFPRMGDLHALRTDPYCDWPDRAFIFFPTYSIHRNLYLHDVLEREREFNARKSEFKARRSPLSYAHASQHTLDGNDTNDITHDAASVYVTPPTSPAPKPDVGLPDISPKPWELDWRARWQVLMNQQPQPPQQLLVPNTHGSLLSPDPTLLQGWQTPLATSAIDNANQDVWDDSDDIDLPLDNPQTMYDLGNSIARGPTPTPAFAPTAAPVVRLPAPASGLKRTVATVDLVSECQDAAPTASTSAPAALQASSDSDRALELLCATMSEALKEIGPTSAAASAQGPPSADAQFVQEQESVPERPASPAPTFFFYDVEEEEDSFEEESGLAPFERSRAGGFDVDALLSAPPQPPGPEGAPHQRKRSVIPDRRAEFLAWLETYAWQILGGREPRVSHRREPSSDLTHTHTSQAISVSSRSAPEYLFCSSRRHERPQRALDRPTRSEPTAERAAGASRSRAVATRRKKPLRVGHVQELRVARSTVRYGHDVCAMRRCVVRVAAASHSTPWILSPDASIARLAPSRTDGGGLLGFEEDRSEPAPDVRQRFGSTSATLTLVRLRCPGRAVSWPRERISRPFSIWRPLAVTMVDNAKMIGRDETNPWRVSERRRAEEAPWEARVGCRVGTRSWAEELREGDMAARREKWGTRREWERLGAS
ncbi:hypothetical protein BD413DRAFT_496312 [Trametes elegans]|nr:hypothetical protein BD413DRAFT_496312 [Trametes elegans]